MTGSLNEYSKTETEGHSVPDGTRLHHGAFTRKHNSACAGWSNWIGGFALIATPAQYRVTGVKILMVSQDGVVYEKDLGPNTLEIARRIDRFNPDSSWKPVEDR